MRPHGLGLAALVPGLVVAAVVLTTGAAVFVALHFGRGLLLRQDRAELAHHADSYATAVRFYLEGARSTIQTTAAMPPIAEALRALAPATPEPQRARAIAAARVRAALILQHSRVFDDVALLGADGTVVFLEPAALEAAQVRRDRAFTDWYWDVLRTGRTVVSDLHLSVSTLQPTVVVASPVREQAGRVIGVWAGSLRLQELSRVGLGGDPAPVGHGFVTDRRGLVVAHQTEARYVQHQTDFSAFPPVRAALAAGRGAGRFEDPIERVEQISAWAPLAGPGWAVVYQKPVHVALAPIRSLSWNIVAFAAAIAAGLGALGVLLARRLVRPLEQLTEAAERVGPGVPRFEVQTRAGTEAARLAQALNRMVAAIVEKDAALRDRTKELERVVIELEAASRAKDQFLATLSHELRTPLNAVYGWARMLRSAALDPGTTQRALDAIERNASAQVQLIDDLLDVSRIVTGKMRLDVRPVALDGVIHAALDTVRPAAEAKGIRLQPLLDPRASPIKGDPERLQQVVWNLLVNAVKFTPRGGRVQVHLQRVHSHVEIAVSDTGQGIGADVLPHVFDRFQQADSGPTRAHSGLGIGLALVRHLVELHGGGVYAHSDGEGKGATFVVKLPLVAAEPPAAEGGREHPTARTGVALAGPSLDGIRVLVVDDDPDGLHLIGTILTRQGAAVKTCASAAAAVREFDQAPPDVLLSDIEMPGEDGYGLIRRIRSLPVERGGNVPAAAITAYGRIEDRVRALSAGFTTHLPKPVDPGELAAVVSTLARQGGSSPALRANG
ncbi:MAG: hybrid sensor histidine kinase/response regulator [Candidatus Rokuibacteriota bacterium]